MIFVYTVRVALIIWLLIIPVVVFITAMSSMLDAGYGSTFREEFSKRRRWILISIIWPIILPIMIFKYIKNDLKQDIKELLNDKKDS